MDAERWVEKVHPLTRAAEPDDPLEMMASAVPGDPDVMLDCLLEEFAWMGCDGDELLAMFASPAYPVLNQLLACFGPEVVRDRIAALLPSRGVVRFTEFVADDPDEEEDEPELIQLSLDRAICRRPGGQPGGEG